MIAIANLQRGGGQSNGLGGRTPSKTHMNASQKRQLVMTREAGAAQIIFGSANALRRAAQPTRDALNQTR
jgi:hypothetical protein